MPVSEDEISEMLGDGVAALQGQQFDEAEEIFDEILDETNHAEAMFLKAETIRLRSTLTLQFATAARFEVSAEVEGKVAAAGLLTLGGMTGSETKARSPG